MASISLLPNVDTTTNILAVDMVGTHMDMVDLDKFNTYKNFGIFPAVTDLTKVPDNARDNEDYMSDKKGRKIASEEKSGHPAVRSLFNPFAGVVTGSRASSVWPDKQATTHDHATQKKVWDKTVAKISQFRVANNSPLMDSPDTRLLLEDNAKCDVKSLVEASKAGILGRAVYNYADFMYCKHLGKISNNYLVTLRRFPIPVTDSLYPSQSRIRKRRKANNDADTAHPIGSMVTWMGVSGNSMNEILKYSFSMPYEEKQAQWEELQKQGGTEGPLNAIEAAMNPATRKAFVEGKNIPALNGYVDRFGGSNGPYAEPGTWYDSNKVYGPIDRIKSNYRRSEEGLKQNMSFNLVFEYELRSYNGINPKQAMLDLIGNILAICYTNGGFWKGGYRGGGVGQSSVFRNLNIFKVRGGFTEFMDAFSDDAKNLTNKAGASLGINNIDDVFKNPGQFLKVIGGAINSIGGMLIGGFLNKMGRPAQYMANSLLSEAPTGLWHVTIGNPKRPIMMMGNMVIKNTTIEHSGPLGLDDFPTYLKVTVELDRGKPRDAHGLENLYMRGNDRISYSMSRGVTNMYANAARYKKAGDAKGLDENAITNLLEGKDVGRIDLSGDAKGIYSDYLGPADLTGILWSAREQAEGAFKVSKPHETTKEEAKSEAKK